MTDPKPTADDIRREIEKTRADLAATADALSKKLDVKAQAGRKVDEVKESIGDAAANVKAAAPEPVQHAVDRTSEALAPAVQRAGPYRPQILAGVSVAALVFVVLRRRSRRSR